MNADHRRWWDAQETDRVSSALIKQFNLSIADGLSSVLGSELIAVRYNYLDGEVASEDDLLDTDFYLGGEVELLFAGEVGSRHITWDENAGWDLHFSVRVDLQSYWTEGALKPADASIAPAWKYCVGQRVERVTALALEDTPCAVVLSFAGKEVVLGSACGGLSPTVFGDGDDVFVESYNPVSDACRELMPIWSKDVVGRERWGRSEA